LSIFSHVHPVTPLILYSPVIVYMLYLSFEARRLSLPSVAGLFLLGTLIWTLLEYIIHRHLFHYEPKTWFGKQLHFIVHGVHHDYPNDAKRLVMPPIVSIPLAIAFFGIFFALLGRLGPAVSAGFAFGYVCYDAIHYAIHHFPMKRGLGRWLKQHHLRHHFQDDHTGFGVSSPLWDHVFGTARK
jgi:sterol desaturase/sphingolipid hydroxylase (fatty acid hydroxylase superfamily)